MPWEPDALQGLIGELLDAAEEGRVQSFLVRCEQEGLTGKLVKEIEKDAHFPKTAKIILKQSLPRLAAKWLNKAGISAENQDEVLTLTAVLLILQSQRKISIRISKAAEDLKQVQAVPSEAGKKLAEKGKP